MELHQHSSSPGGAASGDPPPQFFVNQKRGEVNELRGLLKSLPPDNPAVPQHRARRREVLKRLITYMTLGIDVSALFPDVVLASATTDPVQKKLLALYLSNYAELNADLSILAINALQKDLRDIDPRIRGLALKALTSLGVETVAEYSEQAVRDGLNDPSAYVRKSAIIGVLKLLETPWASEVPHAKELRRELLGEVRKNLYASEPQLFINGLLVLSELEGGLKADRKTVVSLFNKMEYCDVFGRTLILNLLSDFTPKTTEEMLSLLDALETQLLVGSPSIVLSALKVMLQFVKSEFDNPASEMNSSSKTANVQNWTELPLVKSCVTRARPPILTLLATSSSSQGRFVVLSSLRHLISMGPSIAGIFADDWPMFEPHYSEKGYNKLLKLNILDMIVNEDNWEGIRVILLTLLSPPTGMEDDVMRTALQVLCNIGLQIPGAAEIVANELLDIFKMEIPEVCSATLPLLAALLAKHAHLADNIIPFMGSVINLTDLDPTALSAFVWIVGEFSHIAGYSTIMLTEVAAMAFDALNAVSDEQLSNSPPSSNSVITPSDTAADPYVRVAVIKDLLVACCKLLFIDPDSVEFILADLLAKCAENINTLPPDVADRYLITLRLISKRRDLLAKVYGPAARKAQRQERENSGVFLRRTTVLPKQPLSRLNTISAVCVKPVAFLDLPFGKACV